MRQFLLLLALMFFGLTEMHAQTTGYIGVGGGDDFDNLNAGIIGGIEVPVTKHFEVDLFENFSPFESHVKIGKGFSNLTSGEGIVWFSDHWGLDGRADYSMYAITGLTKRAYYGFGGLAYSGHVAGAPASITIDYFREFHNGVYADGIETNHLQGAEFDFTVRLGCTGPVCWRAMEYVDIGRSLTQGDPYCDGSIGPKTCGNRGSGIGGGFTGGIAIEFPRRRWHENDPL